jgi:MoaA/NifB/PqqE/SkfB family radical SAM enzyme
MALEQVFLYVTQKCNLRCITCYALDQLERAADLPPDALVAMLARFRADGAWRLSFLGGEPTVHPGLGDLAVVAKDLGFRFVRVNTNGMFRASLLRDPRVRSIDVFCFSIDGATAAVNDAVRRGGRLDRVLDNMREAASRGYDVRANVTVTARNIDQLFDLIRLVERCGGTEINLNVMFLMGYALAHDDLAVDPDRWQTAFEAVIARHREFAIRIKLPRAFTTPTARERPDGHRCLAVDRSRVYVASNGDVYPCLTMMDDPANRIAAADPAVRTPGPGALSMGDSIHDYCHFIRMKADGARPLCIFHKVRLNE